MRRCVAPLGVEKDWVFCPAARDRCGSRLTASYQDDGRNDDRGLDNVPRRIGATTLWYTFQMMFTRRIDVADNIENLILEHLRAIRADIGGIKDDVREIKQRLTSLEAAVAGLRRDNANLYGDVIGQQARYDRLAERVERIERRLDLADG